MFSIEVFPPKRDMPVDTIYEAVGKICELGPDYISVTYGAGGSGVQKNVTCELASFIKKECGVEPLAHLTCINSTKEQIEQVLCGLEGEGIENALAMRGDRVPDVPEQHDFHYASELISYIHARGSFDIAAACYPEGHPESECLEAEIDHLKEKVDNGATHLISQLFFDNNDFYHLMDLCEQKGIHVPVQAGIMPVINAKQITRMVSLCGAKLPAKFSKVMARYGENPEAMRDAGIYYATEQIIDLISSGVHGIHLYAMNRPYVAEQLMGNVKSFLDHVNAQTVRS